MLSVAVSIGSDQQDKVDRVDRVDMVDKVDKVDGVDRVDKAGRVDKVDKVGRVDRVDKVLDRVDKVDKVAALTKNRLNKERDNNSFAQLTNEEKIEKFLSPVADCPVLQRSKNSVVAVTCAGAREAMTPRTQSKFAHLIRNLRESNEDEQLVVYKMMETDPCSRIRVTDVVPYKGEPKVKLQ